MSVNKFPKLLQNTSLAFKQVTASCESNPIEKPENPIVVAKARPSSDCSQFLHVAVF